MSKFTPSREALYSTPPYELLLSGDGRTLWINAEDGSCIARFSKTFGIDLHRTVTEQLAGANQCLFCTHQKPTEDDWATFRYLLEKHYGIEIPPVLITFP